MRFIFIEGGKMKKINVILIISFMIFSLSSEGKAQLKQTNGSVEPFAPKIDITLSVPMPFTFAGDAQKIFGSGTPTENPSNLNLEGDATYYLSPNFQVGLCYKYDHKVFYGPVSLGADAGFTTDMNAILTRWQARLPLSDQFNLNFFVGAGLFLVSGTYDDNPMLNSSNPVYRLNGQGFGGDVGLSFFFNFTPNFALGLQGGYQYAPVGPLTLDRSSPYLKMSGNQVLNQDGSPATIDFSGWFINFMSLRITL